jgi:hypothetical protein
LFNKLLVGDSGLRWKWSRIRSPVNNVVHPNGLRCLTLPRLRCRFNRSAFRRSFFLHRGSPLVTTALTNVDQDFLPCAVRENEIFARLACSELEDLGVRIFECRGRLYPDRLPVITNAENIKWFKHNVMLARRLEANCPKADKFVYVVWPTKERIFDTLLDVLAVLIRGPVPSRAALLGTVEFELFKNPHKFCRFIGGAGENRTHA